MSDSLQIRSFLRVSRLFGSSCWRDLEYGCRIQSMRSILFGLFASLACLAETQHVTYSYDDAGHLTQVDYGNGQTITYSYDKAGNLLSNTVTSAAASQNRKA